LDLFKKIIGSQIKQMRMSIRKLFRRYNVEAVHDLRVAALRTDFALNFCEQSKGIVLVKKIRNQLKEARRIMGRARNLDILFVRTEKNLKNLNLTSSQAEGIMKLIQSHRNTSHQALMRMLESSWFEGILKDLERIKNERGVPDLPSIIKGPFKQTINFVLEYRNKEIHAFNLHVIRIAFKKLHYACEFFEEVDKPRMQKALKFILKFQDLLGERQDGVASEKLLSGFEHKLVSKFLKMEKVFVKDHQKKFEKLWKESFLKSSILVRLHRWAEHYS